jgi:FKBP-type peptidyl-prolyl cis-trans isomerase FklB
MQAILVNLKKVREAMRHFILILICFTLISGSCFAADNFDVKNQNDRDSYSLGYQYGETLKKQDWPIRPEIFMRGLRDGLGEGSPALSKEEMQQSLLTIRKRMMATRQKKFREKAEKNLRAGNAFLELNGKTPGVRTLPSGLQYRVITDGTGRMPTKGDTVTVNYIGTFIDGVEFDSTLKRGRPETFRVSDGIPGWTEALQLMKEGAKWQLFVPSGLAYGETGQGSRIPPGSTLVFEMELLSVTDTPAAVRGSDHKP